jgi:NAD dependent epimerase/dehydratase
MNNQWQGKKVLVTGAGGFIGSHLCERLVTLGADVTALVKYSSSGYLGNLNFCNNLSQLKIVFGNVEDPQAMDELVRGQDTVLHLAALIGIPYSYRAVHSYIATNVMGTFNVLHAARTHKIKKIVVTSTSECYGTARTVPISEEHPLQGQSPYAASKIASDKISESMQLSFDLPVATIRPFNTFGPRQSARAVIPTIISQALANKTVKIGSLTPTRDFNFVDDTVEGFLRVAESEKSIGQVFNIGSGKEISIGDVCQLVKKIVGYDFLVQTQDSRVRPENSEVQRLLADTSKAAKLLGWAPKVSFEDGLRQSVAFISANPKLYNTESYVV